VFVLANLIVACLVAAIVMFFAKRTNQLGFFVILMAFFGVLMAFGELGFYPSVSW